MKRYLVVLVALLALPLAIGIAALVAGGPRGQAPVYSVAQVQGHLADDPGAWVGRTVRLRAIADPCPMWGHAARWAGCPSSQPVLVDQEGSLPDSLRVTWRQQGTLFALLRGVPLLGGLVPATQALHWGARATYRVQLRAATSCGYLPCYEAVLLDAAPGSP